MKKILPAALACMVLLSGCAHESTPSPIHATTPTFKPLGHMMLKHPELVDFLPALLAEQLNYPRLPIHEVGLFDSQSELVQVKRILDRHFSYIDDDRLHGQREDWRPPLLMPQANGKILGDCDDYAILARAMLKYRGLEARLVYLESEYRGDYHLVAEVDGWLIDNRASVILMHEDTDYRLLKISRVDMQGWHTTP